MESQGLLGNMFSKNRTTEISGRKDLTRNGKKLYCVFTEYIKYPFIYVWAADAENATVWAKQQPTEAFFDFPERPNKWEVIGDVEAVTTQVAEELGLCGTRHPEAGT
jgi:hypothetical protein